MAEERRPGYRATVFFFVVSFPLLPWFLFLAARSSDQSLLQCEALLESDPFQSLAFRAALFLILFFFFSKILYAVCTEKRLMILVFLFLEVYLLLVCGSDFHGRHVPGFGDKPALGYLHSHSHSSPDISAAHKNNNNSEYWKNNVRACVCKDETCEDNVYRRYLLHLHCPSDFVGVALPSYTRVDDDERRPGYRATVFFFVVSFPLLPWLLFLAAHLSDQSLLQCEALVESDPFQSPPYSAAFILIFLFFISIIFYAICAERRLMILVFLFLEICLMLVCGSDFNGRHVPGFGGKPALGYLHSHSHSSPDIVAAHKNNNSSEYWKNNVRACVCKDETCEDNVYRHYLLHLHCPSDFVGVALPSYTRVDDDDDDEVKRPAHDLKGTTPKNGDSRYHKVCYSMHEGNTTLCYDCYACEEKYLRDKRMLRWRLSNHLLFMTLLVILSNLMMFLSESLERNVTLKRALHTDGVPV